MDETNLLLVTGATGLVGSHVVERARQQGIATRALVRPTSDTMLLDDWGAEKVIGDMTDVESLKPAVDGVTRIVHCAAKVGDWGPVEEYRAANVRGLANLLESAEATGLLRRFVHISSLGVYEARDHYGTDEDERLSTDGIDGYTLTKVEAEELVLQHVKTRNLPATVLRPGFIYGPRDRTVMPRILERLKSKGFAFLGSGEKLMNNTFVGNLVDAVLLALDDEQSAGQVYNVTDGRLVSKREFIQVIAKSAGYEVPTRSIPLPVARALAGVLEGAWKLLGKKQAPLLSSARIKFLGLNLDFCIDKIRRELGYQPRVEFAEGIGQTIDWFRERDML